MFLTEITEEHEQVFPQRQKTQLEVPWLVEGNVSHRNHRRTQKGFSAKAKDAAGSSLVS
jgi:hypothetical protein